MQLDDSLLQPNQVDVWRVSLDVTPDSLQRLESILSVDERQRAAKFHFEKDHQRFIASHGCLRNILARYLTCMPKEINFQKNDFGKPALFPDSKITFNLSHSGGYAVVAVARERNVGVDVEQIRDEIEMEDLSRRFFSPSEVAELRALPPEQRVLGFFTCWTRKEAYIKAQGLGLSLPLDSFDVSLGEPATLRSTRPDASEALDWSLHSIEVEPGYIATLAVEGKDLEIRVRNWEVTQ